MPWDMILRHAAVALPAHRPTREIEALYEWLAGGLRGSCCGRLAFMLERHAAGGAFDWTAALLELDIRMPMESEVRESRKLLSAYGVCMCVSQLIH